MNRRTFARNLAGVAAASATLPLHARSLALQAAAPSAEAPPAPWKLSVMLWTVFRKLPMEQKLESVAQAGYKNVQLVGEFKKWSETDYQNILKKRDSLGITFDASSGVTHSLCNPKEQDALMAEIQGLMPTFDRIQCKELIIVPGNAVPGVPRYVQHQTIVDGLRKAAAITAPHGVSIMVENIDPKERPPVYLTSVAEGLEIMKTVDNPNVKFLYDFYHEQIAEGDLIAKLEPNLDQIGIFHIADVPGRHEAGTGEINYQNIFKKLAELKYSRTVAMEYMPTYDEVQSLTAARQFMNASAALAGQPFKTNT
jgi:hydroxypyruvate isomerase